MRISGFYLLHTSPPLPAPHDTAIPALAAISTGFVHELANILTALATANSLLQQTLEPGTESPAMRLLDVSVERLFDLNETASALIPQLHGYGSWHPIGKVIDVITGASGAICTVRPVESVEISCVPDWLALITARLFAASLEVKLEDEMVEFHFVAKDGSFAKADTNETREKLHWYAARQMSAWMGGTLQCNSENWRLRLPHKSSAAET